ncbi:MAG: hypothetical protein ACE5JG_11910, partial [Planctomycetota bacterium]
LLVLGRRRSRERVWEAARVLVPLVDLFGLYAGAAALVVLGLGRIGYRFGWAASVFLVALMIFLTLYDRAVLLPYLARARKRLGAGGRADTWRADWSFLLRLSVGCHLGVLGGGIAALLLRSGP